MQRKRITNSNRKSIIKTVETPSNQPVEQVKTVKKPYTVFLFRLGILGLFMCILGGVLLYRSVTRITSMMGVSLSTITKSLKNPTYKATNGKTTILLLGIGGGNHEAPDLTDSIQLVTLSHTPNDVSTLLSLPRDIWSVTLQDRINTAYYYGKIQERPGGGIGFARSIMEEITGLPVHYVVVIDFSGFVEVIDSLGGIDVVVSHPFIDTEYPVAGREIDECDGDPLYRCRYMTVEFTNKMEHMNGERALMYVRSRHAQGDEGTDFSRGKRQQEVIEGILKAMIHPRTWLYTDTYKKVQQTIAKYIMTDLSEAEIEGLIVSQIFKKRFEMPNRISLESQLINPDARFYQGKYVLIPRESFSKLREYIDASVSGNW